MNAITIERKEELFKELRSIEAGLSPENLYMDGEASGSQIRRTLKRLNKEKVKVINELGYKPTFNELFAR